MTDRHGRATASRGDFLKASMSVGGWTMISRATGFVRLAAIGAVLGPTFLGNLFQTANQLPNLAFELVAGQLIASLLLPVLVGHLDRGDKQASERVAGGFLGFVLVAFSAVGVVLALAGPFVFRVLSIGVDDGGVRGDFVHLGWPLLAVVMPQLALYGLIGVANAVQNARHRFALAAAAPVIENVVVVATIVLFRHRVGSGVDLGDVRTADVVLLGLGSTLGVTVHAAVQWVGAWKAGVHLRPRFGWRDPEVVAVVRLAVPSLGLAGLQAAQTFACLVVVGSVAGGVVAFQLGLAFVATAVALGARPLTVAALPDLARSADGAAWPAVRRQWDRTLAVAVFMLAPIAVGLAAMSPALGQLLGIGEMAGDAAVGLLVAALAGLGLAVLGDGVTSFATQVAYTLKDARSPLQATVVRTLLLTAGLGIAMRLDQPSMVVFTAGLAFSLATVLSAWFLCRATVLRLPAGEPVGRQIGRATVLAVAAGVPALLSSAALIAGPFGRIVPVAGGGLVLGVGYLAAQQFLARRFGWPSLLDRLRPGRSGGPDVPTEDAAAGHGAAPAGAGARSASGATRLVAGGNKRAKVVLGRSMLPAARAGALLTVAIGPALFMHDARWLLLAACTCAVVTAAARPASAVPALLVAGPLTSAIDLRVGTWITFALVGAVMAGVLVAAGAEHARGLPRWHLHIGVNGWSSVLAASLLAVGGGMLTNHAAAGARLGATLVAAVVALVLGQHSMRTVRAVARPAAVATLGGPLVYAIAALIDGAGWRTADLGDLVGLFAAIGLAAIGLAMVRRSTARPMAAAPVVIAAAGAMGAAGGWLAALPLTVLAWLVARHWPVAHAPRELQQAAVPQRDREPVPSGR